MTEAAKFIQRKIGLLKAEIQRLEDKVEALESLCSALENPETVELLREAVSEVVEDFSTGKTALERLRDWFTARGGEPATIEEMASFAGVSESAIRQMIYTTRKEEFSRLGPRPGTREGLFRIIGTDEVPF